MLSLARNKMTTDKDEDGVEIYSKLCKALMHENSINDRSYKLLVSFSYGATIVLIQIHIL